MVVQQFGGLQFSAVAADAQGQRVDPPNHNDLFQDAQRLVRWTLQWLVVNDFMKTLYDDRVVPMGQLAEIQRVALRDRIVIRMATRTAADWEAVLRAGSVISATGSSTS